MLGAAVTLPCAHRLHERIRSVLLRRVRRRGLAVGDRLRADTARPKRSPTSFATCTRWTWEAADAFDDAWDVEVEVVLDGPDEPHPASREAAIAASAIKAHTLTPSPRNRAPHPSPLVRRSQPSDRRAGG